MFLRIKDFLREKLIVKKKKIPILTGLHYDESMTIQKYI